MKQLNSKREWASRTRHLLVMFIHAYKSPVCPCTSFRFSFHKISVVIFPDFKLSSAEQEADKIPALHLHGSTTTLQRRRGLSPQDTCSSTSDGNGIKYSAIAKLGFENCSFCSLFHSKQPKQPKYKFHCIIFQK